MATFANQKKKQMRTVKNDGLFLFVAKVKDRGTCRGHLLLPLVLPDAQQLPEVRNTKRLLVCISQGAAVDLVVKLLFHRGAEKIILALNNGHLRRMF